MRTLPLLLVALIGPTTLPRAGAAAEADPADLESELDARLGERYQEAVRLAELYDVSGNARRAAEHYESALRIRGGDVYVLSQLARLYRSLHNDGKLLPIYAALARNQPTSINWLRELGACHFRLGQREEAEAAWKRILDSQMHRGYALRYLGQIYTQHKLFDKAVETYRKALEFSPTDLNLVLQLAETLVTKGDHLAALSAVASLPGTPHQHYARRAENVKTRAFDGLKLPEPIQALVTKMLEDQKGSVAGIAWAVAQALERDGDAKRAAEFYRRVAREEPNSEQGAAAAAKARQLDPKK
jgi:tetratricopeptide (TPR) repeat protein